MEKVVIWRGVSAGEAMDLDEALDVLRMLLKGEATVDAETEGLYGHLLMDEAARREKLFYFLPDVIPVHLHSWFAMDAMACPHCKLIAPPVCSRRPSRSATWWRTSSAWS